jgi:ABC-type transport system involved in multi-copper enzyme maturation permease subunit
MIWAMFRWEMLQAGRRRRIYFLRWVYAAFLLVQMTPIWLRSQMGWDWLLTLLMVDDRRLSLSNAYRFFESVLAQHYLLLVLVTPAMVGGAIADEKTRGTLEHLLTACFRPGEIILGKLLAHTCQLVLCSLLVLPLFCYFAGLARDASLPAFVFASSAALALGVAALSLWMSVCCRTTRGAVLSVYALIGAVVLLYPTFAATPWGSGLSAFNPVHVLSLDDATLRWRQGSSLLPSISLDDRFLRWPRLGSYLTAWLSLACACGVAATCQLRPAYRRQLEGRGQRTARAWLGTHRLGGNPVLWRPQEVVRIAAFERQSWRTSWLGLVGLMVASAGTLAYLLVLLSGKNPWNNIVLGQWHALLGSLRPTAGDAFFWQGLAALVLLSLLAVIRASGSITGEREKGTWLALMVTPLSTPEIIAGKMRGIFWDCIPCVAAHAGVILPLALLLGYWPVIWTILWVIVMVLTIRWCGAVGLWCSARSASSWRSLLTALTLSYCGVIVLFWRPLGLSGYSGLQFWRPLGQSAYFGLLPVIFGGLLGAGCAIWTTMSWRRIATMLMAFYFGWFLLFWPFGIFAGASRPSVMKEPSINLANLADAISWTFWFWVAAAFWYSTRHVLASAVARVGRADRWEMAAERAGLFDVKLEEKWQAPRINDVREQAALLASENSQTSHMLLAVKVWQIERGASAEMRGDKRMIGRHFLAAAHLELVLAEEYDASAQYELAIESRKSAASCLWRAGQVAEARSLFEELRQGNRFLAREIDETVKHLEKDHSKGTEP